MTKTLSIKSMCMSPFQQKPPLVSITIGIGIVSGRDVTREVECSQKSLKGSEMGLHGKRRLDGERN